MIQLNRKRLGWGTTFAKFNANLDVKMHWFFHNHKQTTWTDTVPNLFLWPMFILSLPLFIILIRFSENETNICLNYFKHRSFVLSKQDGSSCGGPHNPCHRHQDLRIQNTIFCFRTAAFSKRLKDTFLNCVALIGHTSILIIKVSIENAQTNRLCN